MVAGVEGAGHDVVLSGADLGDDPVQGWWGFFIGLWGRMQ
jgi:hypothetical protein